MERIYINRFAIEENDQFEIHVKHFSQGSTILSQLVLGLHRAVPSSLWIPDFSDQNKIGDEEIKNVAQELMLTAQKGSGYFLLLNTKHCLVSSVISKILIQKLLSEISKMGYIFTQLKTTLFCIKCI